MRKLFFVFAAMILALPMAAQSVNYDESKVGPYTLEDPLVFADGTKVRTAEDWSRRRNEILEIFQSEMYGRMPEAPGALVTEVLEQGPTMGGFGLRRQVRMWFRKDKTGPSIDWLIITPARAKGPVPTVLMLNYEGNHTVLPDPEIIVTDSWMRSLKGNKADPEARGKLTDPGLRTRIPADLLAARGYALVTACYADVSPDPDSGDKGPDGEFLQKDFAYTGIFSLWGKRDPSRTDNTTALTAWAWALRRGMDMIEKDSMLDQGHVLLTGSSRLGKAALIAGAFDERFPVVVPNQTGGGGVPLAKRNFGETITTEMKSFTHWYCKAYGRYAGHEDIMPFDQHMLLTCVAPRALLVEGFDQPWFDTKGEFLSVQAASPVWKFLGKPGLPEVSWPDDYDTKAIGPVLGYVRRDQEHGIAMIDWLWMLDFADRQFSFDLDNHIGICGLGWAKQAKASGLNYLEANVVNQLCPESDEATFEQKLKEMKEAGLPIYSANGFFPGTIKLVGPEAETQRAIKYSRTAIRRAAQAGIKILVLGSSKARNIPEGFSTERAREQFLALLKGIAPDAEKYGVIVAIEPLQKSETNFINTVREGAEISRLTGSPNICVIADLFHMMRVGEGPDGIIDSADKLVHCHIAELEERTPPGEKGDDFTPYFKALKQIGFKGGISIECGWKDIEKQLPVAAKTMKEQINKIKQ